MLTNKTIDRNAPCLRIVLPTKYYALFDELCAQAKLAIDLQDEVDDLNDQLQSAQSEISNLEEEIMDLEKETQ